MKFQDMPYERIDFAKVQEEMGELIRELEAAKSGEEQFEVHQKYYALTDRVMTLMTIANIRFDIDTSDKFYEEEHKYYDEQGPVFSNLVTSRYFLPKYVFSLNDVLTLPETRHLQG